LHSLSGFNASRFLASAATNFEVTPMADQPALFSALEAARAAGKSAFGFAAEGSPQLSLLTLKDAAVMDKLVEGEHSAAWKRMDVTVLHTALLEKLLGIDAEKLAAETNIHYVRGQDEALDLVGKGYQAAFLVNPTRIEQVREIALAGERMPQKSTDFFPKLLSGMVMMKMTIDKSAGVKMWQADE